MIFSLDMIFGEVVTLLYIGFTVVRDLTSNISCSYIL